MNFPEIFERTMPIGLALGQGDLNVHPITLFFKSFSPRCDVLVLSITRCILRVSLRRIAYNVVDA